MAGFGRIISLRFQSWRWVWMRLGSCARNLMNNVYEQRNVPEQHALGNALFTAHSIAVCKAGMLLASRSWASCFQNIVSVSLTNNIAKIMYSYKFQLNSPITLIFPSKINNKVMRTLEISSAALQFELLLFMCRIHRARDHAQLTTPSN